MAEPSNATSNASASELVKQLSEQTSRLVQQEMELAKAELSVKGKQVGIGAGLFGGAGVFGL